MYKSCSRCGKIHSYNYKCNVGKSNYKRTEDDKLRVTYAWKIKAKEIKDKSRWLCAVCKDKGIYTYDGLEVHHIIKLREAPEKLLDNDNLICLCLMHHRMAEKGQLDKDYLRKLVRVRECGRYPPMDMS